MLSKDEMDAGKLDTSCRILLGNTSVVKVGINGSADEVRDAKAGDVDTSRPRVDVGSMSKTCELESEISPTEVVSGTSCGLVVGVSSLKENKDVGEGEKSIVVKSSSVSDVMDMTCEVSKAVGEGCSDPSKTWLETGASRLIMLENPKGSLELASSTLMVGVGKISTTNVLSVSSGLDDASGSDRDADKSREGAGVGVRRAIAVVLGSEGIADVLLVIAASLELASSMLVAGVGKISTDVFSNSVKNAEDSIRVSDASRKDETCNVGAGVGVGRDSDVNVKAKAEDIILVVVSSAIDETIAEDSTLSIGLGDKVAFTSTTGVERRIAAVIVSSNPMDDTNTSMLCVEVATSSLSCMKLGVGTRLTASVESMKTTEVAMLASGDDRISSEVVTGRVTDVKALINSVEKLDGSKFVKAVLTTLTEDSVNSIPCVELKVGKGIVASAKDAGALDKILVTSMGAVSLLKVGSVAEGTTEEIS